MSQARDLADLGSSAEAGTVTGENLIINGDMAVAQRGTSETGITSSKYANAPDRFKVGMYDCGTWTASQSTTSPDGFSNSYKLACTTAKATLATDSNLQFYQRIEGQNLQHLQKGSSGAKSVTVSFYVRTNKTGTYTLELFDRDNTRVFSKTYSVSTADTWEYKSVTFDGDTTGAFGNDNGVSLDVNWWLAAGTDFTDGTFSTGWASRTDGNRVSSSQVNIADSTSNTWQITGIKLEVGSTATPFQHESYGENLAKCQRYYQKDHYEGGGIVTVGHASSGTVATASISYSGGQMRTAPTITLPTAGQGANLITFLEGDAGYPTTTGSHSTAAISNTNFRFNGTGYATFAAGNASWLYTGPTAGDVYFEYDAEL